MFLSYCNTVIISCSIVLTGQGLHHNEFNAILPYWMHVNNIQKVDFITSITYLKL